ncbi:hypothetical protein JCM10207_002678 [Rhodosporidiobolus poonsookiae]
MAPQTKLDLHDARQQTSFNPEALHRVLRAGSRDSSSKRRIVSLLSKNPSFDKRSKPYFSRAQQIEHGLKLARGLIDVAHKHDFNQDEFREALSAADEPIGLYLHEIAFTPVIASQGSDEQQAEWLPKAHSHAILGCYLQTELGHGSNVQQLETTATYESATDSFILRSPTVSATKWWIGGLGILSTHGVVQARLILNGKDYGPHLFICQLRSLDDHNLMPGIEAGEIGPKVHGGGGSVDNGWARFTHVRVPRKNMLSRFARVSPEDGGKYVKPPHAKLSYGSMVYIRAQMISSLAWRLAKAVTISTRYLHQRRQFGEEGADERQVITYPSVYMRVIPQVANAIVFITVGKVMTSLYNDMSSQLSTGNTALLAETHAVASGLKVYVSTAVVDGLETVRRAMGGHGVLASTGVGRIYAAELPSATYEGDNYILNLQVARAALKSFQAFMTNSSQATLTPSTSYLSSLSPFPTLPLTPPTSAPAWASLPLLTRLLSLRAALSVARLAALVQSGKPFSELSWECAGVSEAVVEAFLAERLGEALVEGGALREGAGEKEQAVLEKVVLFSLLHRVSLALPSLLELGILPPPPPLSPSTSSAELLARPVEQLRAAVDDAARALLPELIGLTDAFGFSDWELDSVAGMHDGGVYERMLERAKADEALNIGDKTAQERLYREYIRPILQRGRRLMEEGGVKAKL